MAQIIENHNSKSNIISANKVKSISIKYQLSKNKSSQNSLRISKQLDYIKLIKKSLTK